MKIVASSVQNVILRCVSNAEYLPLVVPFVTLMLQSLLQIQRLSDATIRAHLAPTFPKILLYACHVSLPAIPVAARPHAYRAIELTRPTRQSFSLISTKSAMKSAQTSQSPRQVSNVTHVSLPVKLVRPCQQNVPLVKKDTFCIKTMSV